MKTNNRESEEFVTNKDLLKDVTVEKNFTKSINFFIKI